MSENRQIKEEPRAGSLVKLEPTQNPWQGGRFISHNSLVNIKNELEEIVYKTRADLDSQKQDMVSLNQTSLDLNKLVKENTSRISALEKDVAEVKQQVVAVKQEVSDVKNDVIGVKNDILGVKSNILEIRNDILGLKENVAQVQKNVEKLLGLHIPKEHEGPSPNLQKDPPKIQSTNPAERRNVVSGHAQPGLKSKDVALEEPAKHEVKSESNSDESISLSSDTLSDETSSPIQEKVAIMQADKNDSNVVANKRQKKPVKKKPVKKKPVKKEPKSKAPKKRKGKLNRKNI
jgi:archaellum component FlaC